MCVSRQLYKGSVIAKSNCHHLDQSLLPRGRRSTYLLTRNGRGGAQEEDGGRENLHGVRVEC